MTGYESPFDAPDNLGTIGPEAIRGQIAAMTYSKIMALASKSPTTVETVRPCDSKPSAKPCVKNK